MKAYKILYILGVTVLLTACSREKLFTADDFEIKGIKRLLSKSSYIIKNSLPDFLYYKMLHQYHKKDLRKFINECKKKSIKIPDNIIL